MALIQTRPHELDLYTQLDSGEPNYIDPDELVYMVDHPSFEEPRRVPSSSFGEAGSLVNVQKDTLTSLVSRAVSVTFTTAFSGTPVTVAFSVYRYVQRGGNYVKENVLYTMSGSGWLTASGFSITIDDDEDLSGIYIDYYFA